MATKKLFKMRCFISLLFSLFVAFCLLCCDWNLINDLYDDTSTEYVFYSGTSPWDSSENEMRAYARYEMASTVSTFPTSRYGVRQYKSTWTDENFCRWFYGYEVDGWKFYRNSATGSTEVPSNVHLNSDGTINYVTVSPQPLEFYASGWHEITYTLVLDTNGGSGSNTSVTLSYNESYTLPTAESLGWSRTGYEFAGWAYESDSSYPMSGSTSISGVCGIDGDTATIYAQWRTTSCTISFDGNGSDGGSTPASVTYTYPSSNVLPENTFTKTYHKFSYWSTSQDGSGMTYSDKATVNEYNWPNQNTVTFYAQWERIPYTVTFMPNGSSGSSYTQTFYAGVSQALTTNTFARSGYIFTGWNTAANGSGTSYTNGQAITAADGMTLYAQWKPTCTVSKNSNVSYSIGETQVTFTASSSCSWIIRNNSTSSSTDLSTSGSSVTITYSDTSYTKGVSYTLIGITSSGDIVSATFTITAD